MSSKKLNTLLNAREVVFRLRQHFNVDDNPALAKELGMAPQTFYQWENGEQDIGAKTVLTIALKYGIDLNWLMRGKDHLEEERGGAWLGMEGLSREQREIIEMIGQDRIFASAFMMMYETIASRYREVRGPGPPFPGIEPGPEMALASGQTITPYDPDQATAETTDDTDPKGK